MWNNAILTHEFVRIISEVNFVSYKRQLPHKPSQLVKCRIYYNN